MSVCFEFYVLSGRGLCDGLFPRTEETYGCLSVVSDVCCQVEVCATVWSLFQRSPYGCLSVMSVVCCPVEFSASAWSLVQKSRIDVRLLWVLCVVHLYREVLWISVCFECCVLLCSGLCDGLINCTEVSYEFLSVLIVVCSQVEVSATGWSHVQRSHMDVCLLWVLCVVR